MTALKLTPTQMDLLTWYAGEGPGPHAHLDRANPALWRRVRMGTWDALERAGYLVGVKGRGWDATPAGRAYLVGSTLVAGRAVRDYQPMAGHPHGPSGGVVGYVVRETIRGGCRLAVADGPLGVDVAAFDGATQYGAALDTARGYRQHGGYAVVDSLYACGCRS